MALNRRSFLTFAAGGVAGTLFTPVIWKSIDDTAIWTQNWPWIPRLEYGARAYAATTCKLCPAGCGLNIRTAGGRPVAAEGRTDHPLSQGGICPLGAAAVQLLYLPARIKGPMQKQADGTHQPISWDEAETLLKEKLAEQRGKKDAVVCVSGDENGTINELFSALLGGLGSEACYQMPGERQVASRVLRQGSIGYDLENADLVLAFGPDLLDSWGTIVRNKKAFGAAHPIGEEASAKYVYVGPMQNITGGAAEQWITVAPGMEGVLALGIAYHLLQAGLTAPQARDFVSYRNQVINRYTPEFVERLTGVTPDQVAKLAEMLRKADRPLIVPGTSMGQGGGVFGFAAALSLNLLFNNVNVPGGIQVLQDLPTVVPGAQDMAQVRARDLVAHIQAVADGRVEKPGLYMAYEANPLFALPQPEVTARAFEGAYLVSFSTFYDETAAQADLLLPTPTFMERFDDVQTPYGSGFASYSLTRPVIRQPIFDTKPTGDVVLNVAKALDIDLEFASFDKVLEAKVSALAELEGFLVDAVQPWEARAGESVSAVSGNPWRNISRGAVWASITEPFPTEMLLGSTVISQTAPSDAEDWTFPVSLVATDSRTFGSRHIAIPPFCLPLLGEQELQGDVFFVQMNSATARSYGLQAEDLVRLTGPAGSCLAKVRIFEGVGRNMVSAPLGFGRTAWDKFSRNKGDNIYKVLTVRTEPGSNLAVWADSRVRIAKA
ncbi:menaquinone reductase molybdopterin-binding-like subunit QrcB [Desulfonatronum thioautotrophicum]|uniref:menaquinone reductase molybdopterin-binding-like subunit QrcB n=1 Tax=Desulfonatronum thioautotrophicum TaxID=617001 RepID=UPI0005EB2164|nr:menaquinone reductase molybdopterin-binding-like subunit QrcB [Desulfonatronum thioautotrophicum]